MCPTSNFPSTNIHTCLDANDTQLLVNPSSLYISLYRILPNKRACLNKHIPRLLTLSGYILETTKPIPIIYSALNIRVPLRSQSVTLMSDKGKGSFCASAPGAFIRRNTVPHFDVLSIPSLPYIFAYKSHF